MGVTSCGKHAKIHDWVLVCVLHVINFSWLFYNFLKSPYFNFYERSCDWRVLRIVEPGCPNFGKLDEHVLCLKLHCCVVVVISDACIPSVGREYYPGCDSDLSRSVYCGLCQSSTFR